MIGNPFVAKHSWESVLVRIVEGLEDGSVVLPEDVRPPEDILTVGPEEIMKWKHLDPFVPFRLVTKDNAVYEVIRPDLVMVGITSVVIGRPSLTDPKTYSQCEIVELERVARLERGLRED